MKPEISEFTYGFAVLHELSLKLNCKVVPYLPNLVEEKRLGYDAKILGEKGIPLFFQFKLSEYMKGRKSKQYVVSNGSLDLPYYRFWITGAKSSPQHEILIEFEKKGNEVYYAAPNFYKLNDINQHWLHKDIVSNSVLVSPSKIGLFPDTESHSICFDNDSVSKGLAYRFSEKKEVELENVDSFVYRLSSRFSERQEVIKESIERLSREYEIAVPKVRRQINERIQSERQAKKKNKKQSGFRGTDQEVREHVETTQAIEADGDGLTPDENRRVTRNGLFELGLLYLVRNST